MIDCVLKRLIYDPSLALSGQSMPQLQLAIPHRAMMEGLEQCITVNEGDVNWSESRRIGQQAVVRSAL
jgi:hypothetical protein